MPPFHAGVHLPHGPSRGFDMHGILERNIVCGTERWPRSVYRHQMRPLQVFTQRHSIFALQTWNSTREHLGRKAGGRDERLWATQTQHTWSLCSSPCAVTSRRSRATSSAGELWINGSSTAGMGVIACSRAFCVLAVCCPTNLTRLQRKSTPRWT